MAQKNSKDIITKLFIGVTLSAIAVILILVFGNPQNNYTAESAENIFYDQFFKWTTAVQDSIIVTTKSKGDTVLATKDLANYQKEHDDS